MNKKKLLSGLIAGIFLLSLAVNSNAQSVSESQIPSQILNINEKVIIKDLLPETELPFEN